MKTFDPSRHQAKKRFGQNFLQDFTVIDRIVAEINAKPGQHIVEIGPGLGALTKAVLKNSGRITVIELDRTVIPKLRFNCDGLGELEIIETDALRCDFAQFGGGDKIRVIGNLPYNISTPLLFHLFAQIEHIEDMHFMLQKEVVQRLVAEPGSKQYGRLSVMAQLFCECQQLFIVPPEAFYPAPKVDSAVVRLIPRQQRLAVADSKLLGQVVLEAFNQRRKTIRNCWKKRLSDDDFASLQLNPSLRPENLDVETFVKVANYCAQQAASN